MWLIGRSSPTTGHLAPPGSGIAAVRSVVLQLISDFFNNAPTDRPTPGVAGKALSPSAARR